MIKKIIISALLIGALGIAVGLYLFNKPLDSIDSMTTDYQLASHELLASFEENEASANILYLDKVIEVNGIVLKTTQENGKTSVYLSTNNELSNVILQLEQEDERIQAGSEATFKGICTGYLMDVVLVRAKRV